MMNMFLYSTLEQPEYVDYVVDAAIPSHVPVSEWNKAGQAQTNYTFTTL